MVGVLRIGFSLASASKNLFCTPTKKAFNLKAFKMVGVAELESATPCVSCKCSNQLSYTPVELKAF